VDLQLTETQTHIRDLARRFARERLAPTARQRDREAIFPTAELHEAGELGLLGVNVPEELGGSEAGVVAYALAIAELAEACASTTVAVAVTNMVAEQIARFGTDAQRKAFVPRLVSGKAVAGAFALSETQCGSDASALTTSARRDADGWVVNGQKQWITSGDRAGVVLVFARTGGPGAKGVSAFLVEGGAPGMTAGRPEHKMGLRGSSTVPLTFENCRLATDALLGEEGGGFKIAMSALDGGRIGISAQAIGVLRGCLAASRTYAKQRKAFGGTLAELQAIQWKLADMATDLAAAELLCFRAASLKDQGRPFTREASMSKVFCSEAANRHASEAVQIHGGYGYIDEFPVERYFRDARVQTLYEGTSEIQRKVIAREILK
jgi:alkylation response protein AidB-like acyl-CoA dehydrogenase